MAQIRDPIHGSIEISADEVALVDAPFYQRLRNVMQLGFTVLAFPGGTHSRYSHGIGAMQVASRMFDSVPTEDLPAEDRARFRQALRIAVLTHDIGHAPLSHASEAIMCRRSKLALPAWTGGAEEDARRANHEDYTLKILLDSDFGRTLADRFGARGISPETVAGLITGRHAPGHEKDFVSGGIDWAPLLRQIVSSELDADRMDYLQRDSFYTGVSYGRYDLDWLATNLTVAEKDGQAFLALHKRAIFAFEDFLLSRYHMFVSVYYHYTPICFDTMLTKYYDEAPGEYEIPADVEKYLDHDDVALTARLRESKNRWAQAIVRRRPWRLAAEINEMDKGYDAQALMRALAAEKIEAFLTESKGVLSKYFRKSGSPRLYVFDRAMNRHTPIEEYTPLYERYSGAVKITRIYVDPDAWDQAKRVVLRAAGAELSE